MSYRIDFYIMEQPSFTECLPFTAQLASKVYTQGHALLLHTDSETLTHAMDNLLWQEPADGFIPHHAIEPTTLHIGALHAEPTVSLQLKLTTAASTPTTARTLQIVPNSPEQKAAAREHYRHYKAQGYDLHTHTL